MWNNLLLSKLIHQLANDYVCKLSLIAQFVWLCCCHLVNSWAAPNCLPNICYIYCVYVLGKICSQVKLEFPFSCRKQGKPLNYQTKLSNDQPENSFSNDTYMYMAPGCFVIVIKYHNQTKRPMPRRICSFHW